MDLSVPDLCLLEGLNVILVAAVRHRMSVSTGTLQKFNGRNFNSEFYIQRTKYVKILKRLAALGSVDWRR
jgi:hypothetical protein